MDPVKGYMATVLKLPQGEIKDLSRTIFFEGSFFFAGRPIPGLVQFPAVIVGSTATCAPDGESVIIVDCKAFSTPTELLATASQPSPTPAAAVKDQTQLCMDRRCSECTKAFPDLLALMAHCSITGHAPEYEASSEITPATPALAVNYCNTALKYALQERMLRWGQAYVEPNKGKELTDNRTGKSLGVEIYRAFVRFTLKFYLFHCQQQQTHIRFEFRNVTLIC
jgi:hypothetical protein